MNYARAERENNEYYQRIQTLLVQRKVANPIIKNITDFMANPFIYEGKRIALYASLSKMFSATDGVFAAWIEQIRMTQESPPTQKQDFIPTKEFFFVSGIPKGSIISTTDTVLMIGDVVGKTTLETVMGRQVLVPHLSLWRSINAPLLNGNHSSVTR